jgi:uncharacterized protein YbjT (DUF2867 family)
MSNILTIFGATGHQGSSVINHVLNDLELSQKYKIRAVTRNVDSSKAKQLQEKVEVVRGDMQDRESLEAALTGTHTVFIVTVPSLESNAVEAEFNIIKTVADIAVEKGVKYIIFSTLTSFSDISGGKYNKVYPFDAKARAEQYIRSLPVKSAFFSAGSFMENFEEQSFIGPIKQSDGTYVLERPISAKARLPLIAAVEDSGKFIGAILADPDKYEGKTFCAATALYDFEEICATISKVTGKTVVYRQVSVEEFRKKIPFLADVFVEGYLTYEEFGYFGPDSESLVAWAADNARGRLTTLEDYLKTHPLELA